MTRIITEIINLKVDVNINTGEVDFNLRVNNDYSLEKIDALLTKEICKRSDKSKELKDSSELLMTIRSLLK